MSKTIFRLLGIALLAPLLTSCAGTQPAPTSTPASPAGPAQAAAVVELSPEAKLRAVVALPHRSEKNRARDIYRHPVETLTFFGVRDEMTVVELWPGGGWYTEILAPYLKDRGKLIVTSFDPNGDPSAYNTKRAQELHGMLAKAPDLFGKVQVAIISQEKIVLGPPASADVVLTFRNLHNWMQGEIAEKVLAAAFEVLKPGGVLGVVDHRGRPGLDPKAGYVEEADAIRVVESVGFQLQEKSEINANAKDTKDHPQGVWTLPPSLRLGETDKAKYLAIGESDRFTLRFVKPAR